MSPIEPVTPPTTSPTPVPAGITIASTLCWIVGVLTILAALVIGIPAIGSGGGGLLFVAVNGLAGVLVCVAAVQIRRRKKIGLLLLLIAWAIPTVVALSMHLSSGGSLLLFAALLLAG